MMTQALQEFYSYNFLKAFRITGTQDTYSWAPEDINIVVKAQNLKIQPQNLKIQPQQLIKAYLSSSSKAFPSII